MDSICGGAYAGDCGIVCAWRSKESNGIIIKDMATGKTILLAEDEEVLRKVIAAKLVKEGYRVIEAEDGKATLDKLKKERPALLLLDMVMPQVTGFEVLAEMRKDEKLRRIPVIIISNSGQPVEIERAKAMGAKDYLIKAEFDPKEVVAKVEKEIGASAGELPPARSGEGDTVLVVEDDKFLRELIEEKLRIEGFQVVVAIDGEVAFQKASEARPSVVLLDLVLPTANGFEVLKKLKQEEATKKIPVIILSNLGEQDDIDRGRKLGAEDFLVKAYFTPNEIMEKVRTVLEKKRRNENTETPDQ